MSQGLGDSGSHSTSARYGPYPHLAPPIHLRPPASPPQLRIERRIVIPPTTVVDHVLIQHGLSQDHPPESLPTDDLHAVPPCDEDPPILVPRHIAGMESGFLELRLTRPLSGAQWNLTLALSSLAIGIPRCRRCRWPILVPRHPQEVVDSQVSPPCHSRSR